MTRVVGVGDMRVSTNPGDVLVTHALGSCLGVTIYDPDAQVGGLLHVMLPTASIDPPRAEENPFMFVDSGLPEMFYECYRLGAVKGRLVVKAAGGAQVQKSPSGEDMFQIGKRNAVILRKLLWKNGVMLQAHDLGGTQSRTLSLHMATGAVTVQSNGDTRAL